MAQNLTKEPQRRMSCILLGSRCRPVQRVSDDKRLIEPRARTWPGLLCRIFFRHVFLVFLGGGPNSLMPAAFVIFGPSYLRHVSKVPTPTGMRPLGVAILETVIVVGPSCHFFVTTSRRPHPKESRKIAQATLS